MTTGLEDAIDIARKHIPIQRAVVREECLSDYVITVMHDGTYRVYEERAFRPPEVPGLLPWSMPSGEPVARVSVGDGTAMPYA